MQQITKYALLFFLSLGSSLFVGCSDSDDEKEDKGRDLPVTIDFVEHSKTIESNKEYSPLVVNDVSSWKAAGKEDTGLQLGEGNDLPAEIVKKPISLTKYTPEEGEGIWNWSGVVFLSAGGPDGVFMADLTSFKSINKITVIGLDNNSYMQAFVYNDNKWVDETEAKTGSSAAHIQLEININKRPVTHLFVTGLESCIKKIIIE